MSENGLIVVGMDGSGDSVEALAAAAVEAERRGARLRVVSAFEPAAVFAARYGIAFPLPDDEVAKNVEEEIRTLAAPVVGGADRPGGAEIVARAGSPGAVLVEESGRADLLVVGHRGRGRVASSLLGSVGLHCVLHAHCSVLVVRPRP